ncbi:MAG: FHA domain-containing protein [Lentisphaeria bacterium]|jgi:pSer/pThr/pTyr-binding forkhead associated (FHA) protein|nr:FHA domain-containing protein [Lentisphaeria bacterium]|tara:strand:- start:87 stop:503 length:417 start_codon:yes stop_codon:yes gene_type:complete
MTDNFSHDQDDDSLAEKNLVNTSPVSRKAIFKQAKVRVSAYLDIVGIDGERNGVELDRSQVYIGRDPECEVHIPTTTISRQHVRIFCRGEEYHVEDLDSTNGTYINGVKIKRCILRNNDQITVGDITITFLEERTREK